MTTPTTYTSVLGAVLTRHLALKRALGRRYDHEAAVLAHLDRFLGARAVDLSPETFTQWGATIAHLKPQVRRAWMRIARNLCLYRQRLEPHCFVPDPRGFPLAEPSVTPYLVTREEITRLLHAADALRPGSTSPLQRAVFRIALVLLYTTGLRRGELVRLTLGDYDPRAGTLAIRASKFHKSRLVPLSADAIREMEAFLVARRSLPHAAATPLLCNCHGADARSYTGAGLAQGLRRLFRTAAVQTPTGTRPRVHDLRHSFAHAALVRWYDAGVDVQARLPALATYMGHVSIVSTQYYLARFAPVAAAASARFAQHCESFLGPAPTDGDT